MNRSVIRQLMIGLALATLGVLIGASMNLVMNVGQFDCDRSKHICAPVWSVYR